MADFSIALKRTLRHEGGYTFHPADKGGETFYGISRKWNPTWEGWEYVDVLKTFSVVVPEHEEYKKAMELVESFYLSLWTKLRLDEVESQELANEIFDCAVNIGEPKAVKGIQKILNNGLYVIAEKVNVDGLLGGVTLRAINKNMQNDNGVLLNQYRGYRENYYESIVANDPTQAVFLAGWKNRIGTETGGDNA